MECPHLEKDTGSSATRKLQGLNQSVWSCEGKFTIGCSSRSERTSGYTHCGGCGHFFLVTGAVVLGFQFEELVK